MEKGWLFPGKCHFGGLNGGRLALSGFAHPVALTLRRAGRPFTQTVLEALATNRITAVNAAHYLDLKAEHFEKLKGALLSRPGSGGDDE